MKKLSLILYLSVLILFPIPGRADSPPIRLQHGTADTVCRDTAVCMKSGPFNLNLLCWPAGGIYFGSPAILGDQFIPILAPAGASLVRHGFLSGSDTTGVCSFLVTVNDTVAPAGIISGPDHVCPGSHAQFTLEPVAHATSYRWSFSGGLLADSVTTAPSLSLTAGAEFGSGYLRVRGVSSGCDLPGLSSSGHYLTVDQRPAVTLRNAADTVGLTDQLCGNTRSGYYVAEDAESYRWAVVGGSIRGDSLSRSVSVYWGTVAGAASLSVIIQNLQGCSNSASRAVTVTSGMAPSPSVIWRFGYNMLVCSDSLAGSRQWYYGGQPLENETKQYLIADTSNRLDYRVETCNDACCNMSEPFRFHGALGISRFSVQSMRVFPDPAHDRVTVRFDGGYHGTACIILYDSFGKEIRREKVLSGGMEIDLSGLPAGIYFVRYAGFTARFIKY